MAALTGRIGQAGGVLDASEPLRHRPRRVIVAGVSGVGKTTLCRRIAAATGISHVEIDALYHGANWTPRDTFDADVDAFTQAPAWITEWQYSSARELLASRADTLVWLDLPIRTALTRVTRRTIQRSRTREELWNGNTEPGLWHALTDDEGIIRWAFQHRNSFRTRVPAAAQTYPHLQVVRLRNQREVDRWVTRAL